MKFEYIFWAMLIQLRGRQKHERDYVRIRYPSSGSMTANIIFPLSKAQYQVTMAVCYN